MNSDLIRNFLGERVGLLFRCNGLNGPPFPTIVVDSVEGKDDEGHVTSGGSQS